MKTWNRPPDDATQLITRGRQLERLKARIDGCFTTCRYSAGPCDGHRLCREEESGRFQFSLIFGWPLSLD